MDTSELMSLALAMAGMEAVPPDSAIYVHGEGIRRILAGIDMGVPELMLAADLGYDCVLAHHPQPAVLTYPDILDLHVAQMVRAGVPEGAARAAVSNLKEDAFYRYHSGNYDHAPSVARVLGMPYLNIHNPLDEIGRRLMAEAVSRVGPGEPVSAVVEALLELEELRNAPTRPVVAVGSPERRAGKVAVAHGAGTNGGYDVAKAYFAHGVDTLVYIHCDPGAVRRLRADGAGTLIIGGHIACDRVGIVPYLRELERRGLQVTRVSGL